MGAIMDLVSLLELLEKERQLCQKINGVDYTLGQMSGEDGGRLYARLTEEKDKASAELPIVRVKIGAKVALYTQMYGDSIRNALGILTSSAEEGENHEQKKIENAQPDEA